MKSGLAIMIIRYAIMKKRFAIMKPGFAIMKPGLAIEENKSGYNGIPFNT